MRVTNKHNASLTLPPTEAGKEGQVLQPRESGDADDKHPVVQAWLKAGMLVEGEGDNASAGAPSTGAHPDTSSTAASADETQEGKRRHR